MTAHRHLRFWVDQAKEKVYSRGLCGEDTLLEEANCPEEFLFKQTLSGSIMSAMTAFQEKITDDPIINDMISSVPTTCEDCEAILGCKVLGAI